MNRQRLDAHHSTPVGMIRRAGAAGRTRPPAAGRRRPVAATLLVLLTGGVLAGGLACGPSYYKLRREGQHMMVKGDYGPARELLLLAEEKSPHRLDNLYDMGVCSLMLARQRFEAHNAPAAFREADRAVAYFDRVLDISPSHEGAIEGKNVALELKGQFDEALEHAEWVAEFVGPSAKYQIFLAEELEERGDVDGAYLRHRQAIAMEPRNPQAHVAFAKFLLRQGKESAAVFHLQRAYLLNPQDRWVAQELIGRNALPAEPIEAASEGG